MTFLKVSEHPGRVEVRLNRPEVRNAFSPQMISEITATFKKLQTRSDVRLITLCGEGSVFCAGADLASMKESVNYDRKKNENDAENIFNMFEAISACPQPVVGAVQGAAFGGAMGLIACCDVVLAEEKTKFCFSEVRLGIAPAVISGFILRKVNLGQVASAMLSGQVFTARRARRMGLVQEIVEDENFQERYAELVREMMMAGPEATRATKALIQSFHPPISPEFRKRSIQTIAELRVSEEGQEGLKSFLEKREPKWRKS